MVREGEVHTRVLVETHGTSRSPSGECGEGRCDNGEIPNLPSSYTSTLSCDTSGSESQALGLATVEGGAHLLIEART